MCSNLEDKAYVRFFEQLGRKDVTLDFNTFISLAEKRKKEKPILFELEHDKILGVDEIEHQENIYGIRIPKKYRQFLLEYGGGYFGFVNTYSLDNDSSFFIPNNLNDLPIGYIPISDNGCGDVYLLKIQSEDCLEQVYFFEHETKEIRATKYSDVFEYLLQVGLSIESE